MKTVGLIGGMGWESSKLYYERFNKKINAALGGSHSAKVIMVSIDFAEIERLTIANDWNAIAKIVCKSAQQLELAGADIVVLCTNLIHIVGDQIQNAISIPFIHIADATGEGIRSNKLKKVLLLGTKYTMEKDFYTKVLEDKYGLKVVIPNLEDREHINNIIYDELLKGIFSEEAKRQIVKIIEEEKMKSIEGVILGCTELPMLIKPEDVNIPTFDTGDIHVEKAVTMMLGTNNENNKPHKDVKLEPRSFKGVTKKLLLLYFKGFEQWLFANPFTASCIKSDIGKMIHK